MSLEVPQVQPGLYLIIYKTPLFQNCVNSDNGTHVASQISPAGRYGQVFMRIESICIDHEIPDNIDIAEIRLDIAEICQCCQTETGR